MTKEQVKKEAREETARHCHEAYDKILPKEVIENTIEYWGERTDSLIDKILTTAHKKLVEEMGEEKDLSSAGHLRVQEMAYNQMHTRALAAADKVLLGDSNKHEKD